MKSRSRGKWRKRQGLEEYPGAQNPPGQLISKLVKVDR